MPRTETTPQLLAQRLTDHIEDKEKRKRIAGNLTKFFTMLDRIPADEVETLPALEN